MTAEMTSLSAAAEEASAAAAVIMSLGARGARVPSLLNAALGTTLPVAAHDPRAPKEPAPPAPVTPLVASAAAGKGVLVLNVHGLDSRNRAVASAVDGALQVALSVAGVILLAIRLPDLSRTSASGVDAFFSALEKNLAHRAAGLASRLPIKRMVVVAVRDFEVEEVTEEELQECVTQQLEAGWGRMVKSDAYARKSFADLFDVRFCLIPNENARASKFDDRVKDLKGLLADASVKRFADAGCTPASIVATAERTAESLNVEVGRNLPADRELAGTFSCNSTMQAVVDRFRNTTRQWKVTVDAGRIIRDFGDESGKLIGKTIEVFEKDCAVYADTKGFHRKRSELKTILLADAQVLYAKQILKLREVAYQIFRGNLGRIRINDSVDRSIRAAVRQAEVYFIEKADSLRCAGSGWKFDHERAELVKHMREDATERLQLARLQGNYVPPIRAPVAFAFHTLLAAPFGQDSRNVHPHAEEMQQKFDPDKVKKAAFMRSRPYPTRFVYTLGGRDELKASAMEKFDDLFVDAKDK